MSTQTADGKFLWALGGMPAEEPVMDDVSVYNIDEDRWYSSQNGDLSPMEHPVRAAGWTLHDDQIFCFGGKPGTDVNCVSTVQVYDIVADEWTVRADMPEPRSKLGKFYPVVDDQYVYLFGGDDAEGRFNRVPWNWRYDLEADEWDTDVADALYPQSFPLPTAHDGWLYYSTGNTQTDGPQNDYPGGLNQRYHPETDRWQVVTPCPHPVTDGEGDQWEGKLHFLGGWNVNEEFYNENSRPYNGPVGRQHVVYDYEMNNWRYKDSLPGSWHHGGSRGGEEYLWRYLGIIDSEPDRGITDRIFRWDGSEWEEMTPAPVAKMNFGTVYTTIGPTTVD